MAVRAGMRVAALVLTGASAAAMPHCSFVMDRHNHKTGGSSMRDVLNANQGRGNCLYWGYGPEATYWDGFLNALIHPRAGDDEVACQLCVEMHFPIAYFTEAFPKLLRAREAMRRRGCAVQFVTRVRNPLSFYLSYYKWTIAGKQIAIAKCRADLERGKVVRSDYEKSIPCSAHVAKSNALDRGFGTDFKSWAIRTPNLQSQLLSEARGSICVESGLQVPRATILSARAAHCSRFHKYGAKQQSALYAMLDEYDIVAPTEEFDLHLLLLQKRSGLEEIRYIHNVPRYRYLPKGTSLPPLHDVSMCPNITECEELINRVAPLDVELYHRYAPAFRPMAVAELGGEIAARRLLDDFQQNLTNMRALRHALDAELSTTGNGHFRYTPYMVGEWDTHEKCWNAKTGGYNPGNSSCMPVPRTIAKIWTDNLLTQRPRSRTRQEMKMVPTPQGKRHAWRVWGAAHADVLRAVGLNNYQ